jgi:hypothetical protein
MPKSYTTDKIGFAAYLVVVGKVLTGVEVKTRNKAFFSFEVSAEEASRMELDYTRSEHFRFFEAFRYLRDRTIRNQP